MEHLGLKEMTKWQKEVICPSIFNLGPRECDFLQFWKSSPCFVGRSINAQLNAWGVA